MPPSNKRDEASQAMLFEGATKNELSILFGVNDRQVARYLGAGNVKPSGERGAHQVFPIKEAALAILQPAVTEEQFVEYIEKLNHTDIPPTLSKEYWNGRMARLRYEEQVGHLWPTEKIVEFVSEAYKIIRMTLMLAPDTIERGTSVTEEQRVILRRITDGIIRELRENLVTGFEKLQPSVTLAAGDGGEPVEDDEEL